MLPDTTSINSWMGLSIVTAKTFVTEILSQRIYCLMININLNLLTSVLDQRLKDQEKMVFSLHA
jgi:hypothetical protein